VSELAALTAIVSGWVQGVCFRAFVAERARGLCLTGSVRNLADGESLWVVAEGERANLERLVQQLRTGPPAARVSNVAVTWTEYRSEYLDFSVYY